MIETPQLIELPLNLETQVYDLAGWAKLYHSDEAKFHHFPHSWRVYEISMWLADAFEEQGYTVNRRNLAFAAVTHDLYAHLPVEDTVPEAEGHVFDSKEDRTAFMVFNHLVGVGYDEDVVAQPVKDLILTTKRGESCEEIEAIILRMADIFNTSDKFEVFEERALAFFHEQRLFEHKTCSFEEWLPGAMDYLLGFITSNLPDWFRIPALENIEEILIRYQAVA